MSVSILYRLSGSPPFRARDEETLYEYIKKGEINFTEGHIKDCSTAGMYLCASPQHVLTLCACVFNVVIQ